MRHCVTPVFYSQSLNLLGRLTFTVRERNSTIRGVLREVKNTHSTPADGRRVRDADVDDIARMQCCPRQDRGDVLILRS